MAFPIGNQPTAANQVNGTSPDGQPTTAQPQQGNAAQPGEYLTRAEFEAAKKAIEEAAFTRAKNLYDAGIRRNRFSAQAQPAASTPAQAGQAQPVPAAQPAPTPPPQPVPAQGQADPGANGDPFLQEVLRYMDKENCHIEPDDPEIQILDEAQDGFSLVLAAQKAVTAKKARLVTQPAAPVQAQGTEPAAPRAPTNLAGAGTRNSNPIANVTSPEELYRMAVANGKL